MVVAVVVVHMVALDLVGMHQVVDVLQLDCQVHQLI
jgi:hypothetical protein